MATPLMLATLTSRREFGDEWLLERKLDGERCIARKVGTEVRLESRTAKELTSTRPEVLAAVAAQPSRHLLLDGGVVAFDGDRTSFTRLRSGQVSTTFRQVPVSRPIRGCGAKWTTSWLGT